MLSCAVNTDMLGSYAAHVFGGQSQGDIARAAGLNASSIHRRVMTVEALRDCPGWNEILTKLEAAWTPPPPGEKRPLRLGLPDIFTALEVTPEDVLAAADLVAAQPPGAIVTMALNLPTAALMVGNECRAKFPVQCVLGAQAAGLLQADTDNGRVLVYRPTAQSLSRMQPAARRGLKRCGFDRIDTIMQRPIGFFSEDHRALAQRAFEAAQLHVLGDTRWPEIIAGLPHDHGAVLSHVMSGGGLEDFERDQGLPGRSAKLALRFALDSCAHYGLLRVA